MMHLRQLRSRVGRLFRGDLDGLQPAKTLPLNRDLTHEERAIAEWLLVHADPPATAFSHQLEVARVTGQCSCGCPTVDHRIPADILAAEPRDNPVGDAIAEVNGKMVGVMLLESKGYLTCLEIYDPDEIERPYGLPNLSSLKPFSGASVKITGPQIRQIETVRAWKSK